MRCLAISVLFALLTGAPAVSAQAGRSEITGVVHDQSGALIPQGRIRLTEVSTGQVFITTIDAAGTFTITNLKPGPYTITVEVSGFKTYVQSGVQLATGERVRLDITLEPGQLSESVTISEDASPMRTESGSLGQVVDNRKIVDLPLNGRNFLSLVSLSAGVAQPPPTTAGPSFPRINGGRPRTRVDANLGSGYAQQWNFAVQRQLTKNMVLEVAYAGSKITHIGIPDTSINQLTPTQLALGTALLQRVPNPFFGQIPRSSSLGDPTIPVAQLLKPFPRFTAVSLYRNNVGNTNYNALQTKLEHRFSRGVSFLASYTRSKLIDDASSVFDASILTGPIANFPVADSFNRRLERDLSNGDIPNVFVASFTYEFRPAAGCHSGNKLQCVRRLRYAKTESCVRSEPAVFRAHDREVL